MVLFIIGIVPVAKVFLISFGMKIMSYLSLIFANDDISYMFDSTSNIVVVLGAMMIFMDTIFLLILGVMFAVGV